MMMMGNGFGSFGMMGGDSTMMILLIAAIGFIIYLAVNKQNPGKDVTSAPTPAAVDSEALKIAKARLANGDISVAEFEEIKKNLL